MTQTAQFVTKTKALIDDLKSVCANGDPVWYLGLHQPHLS
jgi:hypothetical protein